MAVKKPAPKKAAAKAQKPDASEMIELLKQISSDVKDIADMVANLGPKEEPQPEEPDEAA